jgi:hypothetical protein
VFNQVSERELRIARIHHDTRWFMDPLASVADDANAFMPRWFWCCQYALTLPFPCRACRSQTCPCQQLAIHVSDQGNSASTMARRHRHRLDPVTSPL